MQLLSIHRSTKQDKKYMATFLLDTHKIKIVHFGALGYDDYTTTHDDSKKMHYLIRHKTRETWSDPTTAGALSRWILWNKPTIQASIQDFRNRFHL